MNGIKKSIPSITLILMAFSILLFSYCNNNNDAENENAKLIGTWSLISYNIDLMIDDKTFTQYLLDNGFSEKEIESAEEFFKSLIEDRIEDIDLELKDDDTYVSGQETGTWSYDASSKIITTKPDDFNSFDQLVKSVTSTTLVIVFEQINEFGYDEYNGEDIDDSIDVIIEITLSKS
jgi:hypothetical protein